MIFQTVADDGPVLGPKQRRLKLHVFKCNDAVNRFVEEFDASQFPDAVRPRLSKRFDIEEVVFHNETE